MDENYMIDINDYKQELECIYKGEKYLVRDNGAVFRYPHEDKRSRRYDNYWTFGKPSDRYGYMEIASVRVHIIVATAFHGPKPTKEHVVDHIDTNRRNNRPENLRWVTRLENALENPITRKRIIMCCGSIEAFLANPSLLRESDVSSDFSWMKTVTNAEAQVSKDRLLAWAESDIVSSGGTLGEWVYGSRTTCQDIPNDNRKSSTLDRANSLSTDYMEKRKQVSSLNNRQTELERYRSNFMLSLTPGAAQEIYFFNDKPNEYPCTPQEYKGNPLTAYAVNLIKEAVFWRDYNKEKEYVVAKYGFSEDRKFLYVMTKSAYVYREQEDGDFHPVLVANLNRDEFREDEINYQLAEVVYKDNLFVHKRVETGFKSREYLEEIFNNHVSGDVTNIDKN